MLPQPEVAVDDRVGRSSAGTCAGSHSMSRSIASMRSVSEARYCLVQRWIWRAK